MAKTPGRVGRYLLVESIGEGAMGVVYRAHDPHLGRDVAIKVLREQTRDRAARLLREAQAMAKLSHPNLVTVFDAGRDDDRVFLAMELVDGTSLRAWFESHGLTWQERLRAVIDAGRGLVAAHEGGVVHRDFKPENILVDDKGRIKVTDFGLARAELGGFSEADVTEHGLPIHQTATGSVFGTPAYMSPEQHAGTGADARSDQFAFAVTAWEAIWGQRPFVTESLAALTFAIRDGAIDAPPPLKGVPPRIEAILRRALAVDPAHRHPSVARLLDELDVELAPRRKARWPIAVTILLVLAAGGGVLAWKLLPLESGGADADAIFIEHDAAVPVPDEFREVIKDHESELLACHKAAKTSARSSLKQRGIVGLNFDIATDGRVTSIGIVRDDFPGSTVARCVMGVALKWEFPPGTLSGVHADLVIDATAGYPL